MEEAELPASWGVSWSWLMGNPAVQGQPNSQGHGRAVSGEAKQALLLADSWSKTKSGGVCIALGPPSPNSGFSHSRGKEGGEAASMSLGPWGGQALPVTCPSLEVGRRSLHPQEKKRPQWAGWGPQLHRTQRSSCNLFCSPPCVGVRLSGRAGNANSQDTGECFTQGFCGLICSSVKSVWGPLPGTVARKMKRVEFDRMLEHGDP